MKNYGLSKRILVTNGTEVVETKPSDSSELSAKAERECLTNVELELIAQVIHSRDVVFDIGANVGTWTKKVLNKHPNIQVHLFEPVPESYQKLLQNLAEPIETGQVIANNCAVSEKEGDRAFYYYRDKPSWSTFYRRLEVEKQFNLESPESLPVSKVTLDSYCEKMKVRHIHFLKINTEGGEFEVIKGAKELLRKGRIGYLQFEYGGTFLDAGVTLQEVFEYLKLMRYETFKMSPDGLKHIESFSPTYEDYEYSNFLAVDERFKSKVLGQPPTMLDLQDLCNRYNLVPRGIIHIGAHEGKESERYQTMGVQKVLFIEANPEVYKRLVANISTLPNVDAVNCAISNYDGTTTLHVTSIDQSSSILPLKRHLEIYPDIKEVNQITVDCRTLDSLLKELCMSTSDFNIINIDIQGAELMAFQGATDTLKYIDAINTEVNYEELYEGCALIDQLDEFLESYGFERKATTSPYHRSWGDGFYVKTQINSGKLVITMSTLGKNGRFANQLFQYAFLKIYAKIHNLEVRTPPWVGQYLFGHKDPPVSRKLREVKETTNELTDAVVPNTKERFENVDFWGYFQYNTKYYAPYKEYFRSLFRPVLKIERQMNQAVNRLRSKGKTVIGLHLRRGDYGRGYFFVAPSKWYKDWLQDLWCKLDEPVLFIASDEPEKVLGDFAQYNPITTKDLDADLPEAPFYPDFYILGKCDIVAISNSSFSFLACMLNEQGKLFCRPRLSAKALIPFDPWNSETIFRDEKVCQESFSAQQTKGSEFLSQGIEKLRSGHPERALSYFNEALVAFPRLPNLHYALAAAYAELGDIFSSKKTCEIELSLQPDNSGARRLLERIENSLSARPGTKSIKSKCFSNIIMPVKINNRSKLQIIGTEYGSSAVVLDLIPVGSTVISAGVGEDISFDLELIRLKQCRVIGIDPTEKAKRYIERNPNEHFHFLQKALYSGGSKKTKVYKNTNSSYVSESITCSHNMVSKSEFYETEVISISELLEEYEDISLLKMDIEGAEYAVINSLKELDIPQIYIEFHHFCTDFTPDDTTRCIKHLNDMGYVVVYGKSLQGALKDVSLVHRKYVSEEDIFQIRADKLGEADLSTSAVLATHIV